MLIEFSVGNFRSFKEVTTLSMWAANLKSKDNPVYTENVFEATPKYTLLKSMALFGANASGKSNLVKAIYTMTGTVMNSRNHENWLLDYIKPFSLSSDTENEPSFFEIVFVLNDVIFRYGFEATGSEIVSEWLYGRRTTQESYYFKREKQEVKINTRLFNEAVPFAKNKHFHPYALLISSVLEFNKAGVAAQIVNYISDIVIISGIEDPDVNGLVNNFMADATNRKKAITLLLEADIAIEDILPKVKETNLHPKIKKLADEEGLFELSEGLSYSSYRKKYNTSGEPIGIVETDFEDFESEGTQQFFKLSPFILDTLEHGKILVIDEFDARLHPKLSRKIVSLFNMPHTNPNNAQLIFTTHNVTLLNPYLLRRDQICFVEKNRYGVSSLINLAEYDIKDLRQSFEKAYMMGKFGAMPLVENMDMVVEKFITSKKNDKPSQQ